MKTFAQAKEFCPICKGSGVMYVHNGPDDYDTELCHCVTYVAEQKVLDSAYTIRYEDPDRNVAMKRVLTDLFI